MKHKKFQFKGKQILLLGLVALVITAGYYRWTVENKNFDAVPATVESLPTNAENGQEKDGEQKNGEQVEQKAEGKSLSGLKEERDKARDEAKENWKKTAADKEATQESRSEATKKAEAANRYAEQEKTIENQIRAKGYEDCFAQIDESGVSVMVSGGEINGAKVAQMKDIIVSQTQVPVRNIKISAADESVKMTE